MTTRPQASRAPPAPPAEDPTPTVSQRKKHPNSRGGEGSLPVHPAAPKSVTPPHHLSKYVCAFFISETSIRSNSGSLLLSGPHGQLAADNGQSSLLLEPSSTSRAPEGTNTPSLSKTLETGLSRRPGIWAPSPRGRKGWQGGQLIF